MLLKESHRTHTLVFDPSEFSSLELERFAERSLIYLCPSREDDRIAVPNITRGDPEM